MSNEDIIRAYARWEAEGRPDGQHDRHWQEASEAVKNSGLLQTRSADHGGGVGATSALSDRKADQGIKPEDLTTENDQGAT
jgi:hypothetical protein